MSSNQGSAFSPPTPTEPLRLYKKFHKVSVHEGSLRESHTACIQDVPNLSSNTHPPRISSFRNRYMEGPQSNLESDANASSTESLISSISSGWRSSYNTEGKGSSHFHSITAATTSSSYKAQYLPDSPEGVMGNFIPIDSTNMARPQANSRDGRSHDA